MSVLKLVKPTPKFTKERPFVAQIHRCKGQQHSDRGRNLTRRYASLDNSVLGAMRFMLANGQVGDLCELYHNVTGKQLGTVRLNAAGKLVANWLWDES